MSLSFIEVDQTALTHNWDALKSLSPLHSTCVAVVKANAYGHGMAEVVQTLDGLADAFAVDDIEELRALRKLTSANALVLGYISADDIEEALSLGCELALYDSGRLPIIDDAAAKLGKKAFVHLKIDSLLGRQGILPDGAGHFADLIHNHSNVVVRAVYGHFANIEDTTDLTHANLQREQFERAYSEVCSHWPDASRHESATSGLMTVEGKNSPNSWVRIGIGLYGLYPSYQLARSVGQLELRPALKWISHLAQVKTLPAGHPIGYGLTYITPRETRVGIVPQGYSDGYDRGLSNTGEVLVKGKRCAVLGRIAMNMFAVDLSPVPDASPEDEVVLLGEQGSERITAEEIALKTHTINYEVVARISPLLPRVLR